MRGGELVGYELRREVRDAIPAGLLTAAERLLVLEIADDANDVSRLGYPGAEKIARLTDLAERSIQETLNRVGKKWIELRLEVGRDTKGRPVYAHKGYQTRFLFPADLVAAFEESKARRASTLALEAAMDAGATDGATDPGPLVVEGAMDPSQRCDESGERCDGSVPEVRQIRGPSPQSPQDTSSLSSAAPPAVVVWARPERGVETPMIKSNAIRPEALQAMADYGVERDEAVILIPAIEARHFVKKPGWWVNAAKNGTLAERISEERESVRQIQEVQAELLAAEERRRSQLAQAREQWAPKQPGDPNNRRLIYCKECRQSTLGGQRPEKPCAVCDPQPAGVPS